MFPMTPIAAALALLVSTTAFAAPATNGTTPRSLLAQAKGLPADFEEHFFDVPLAVQVERDGQLVGEAMIVLSRDDRLTLIEFTNHDASNLQLQSAIHGLITSSRALTWAAVPLNAPNNYSQYTTTSKTHWFHC